MAIYKKNSIRSDIQYFIRQTISTSKIQILAPFLKLHKKSESHNHKKPIS